MVLPPALIVLDVYPLRRLGGSWRAWVGPAARAVWLEKVPFAVLGAAGAAVTYYAQNTNLFITPLERYPVSARPGDGLLQSVVLPREDVDAAGPLAALRAASPGELARPPFPVAGPRRDGDHRDGGAASAAVASGTRGLGVLRDRPRPGDRHRPLRTPADQRPIQLSPRDRLRAPGRRRGRSHRAGGSGWSAPAIPGEGGDRPDGGVARRTGVPQRATRSRSGGIPRACGDTRSRSIRIAPSVTGTSASISCARATIRWREKNSSA